MTGILPLWPQRHHLRRAADAHREQHQSEPPDGPSQTLINKARSKAKALGEGDPKSLMDARMRLHFDTDERYGTVP